MEKRILIPIDYRHVSKTVFALGDQWAQRTGAELILFHGAFEANGGEEKLKRMIDGVGLKSKHRHYSLKGA